MRTKNIDLLLPDLNGMADLAPAPAQTEEVKGGRKDSQGTGGSGAGSGIGDAWSSEDTWYYFVTSRWF